MHYMQMRRGLISKEGVQLRPPKRARSYGPGARCLVEGCTNRPKVRGLCNKHGIQYNEGKLDIELPTSGHKRTAKAYEETPCCISGCEKRAVSRWMCSKHAQQREAGILDDKGRQLRELKAWRRCHKPGALQNGGGYLLILAPKGYQGATVNGRVLEHRLVMEMHLGRLLLPGEIIHHINGVKTDNRLGNLELRTRKAHPPGAEATAARVARDLEALKNNDPKAYATIVRELRE